MSDITEIAEGRTRLIIPAEHSKGGPGKRTGQVFFNEQMAFNRDVSVMFLRALDKDVPVADAMTATGSRAVRIANEVSNAADVVANDIDPASVDFINANIEANGLRNCRASNRDLNILFSEERFGYVDIDPFGSPIPYIHGAIRGCGRNGILAITATDTAPLAGAHRAKCERRYQSRPIKGAMCHEMGLRILMCSLAKELAKADRGMEPLLSFYADHYFRTYVRVTEGAANADKTLSKLIYVKYDGKTRERSYSCEHDREYQYGPFWGGNLHSSAHLASMTSDSTAEEKRCGKMLELWRNEIDTVPFIYDISELSSFLKISPPPMDDFVDSLNAIGKASKTHMCPTSFKTDLDLKDIIAVYRSMPGREM
ncbi:MAG: tRNA (guanine(10)-N(2))-dimethyltransferase [Methanomassiliicoccaceae archaeon]|jgi:tRNA (guanine26-N2/guanine27-N2)-dimethyltransferase|nr:tRNA (guanine(10)-N(2))-dimethyltransferase [Methanomassiliicoccaceae archaeon]